MEQRILRDIMRSTGQMLLVVSTLRALFHVVAYGYNTGSVYETLAFAVIGKLLASESLSSSLLEKTPPS